MWSEVFSADMFETRFKKEGLLNEATGLSYRREIISRGGSIDAELMIKVNKQQATETERTTGMNASDVLAFMSAHPLLFCPFYRVHLLGFSVSTELPRPRTDRHGLPAQQGTRCMNGHTERHFLQRLRNARGRDSSRLHAVLAQRWMGGASTRSLWLLLAASFVEISQANAC
jgi:hypothetical protein